MHRIPVDSQKLDLRFMSLEPKMAHGTQEQKVRETDGARAWTVKVLADMSDTIKVTVYSFGEPATPPPFSEVDFHGLEAGAYNGQFWFQAENVVEVAA